MNIRNYFNIIRIKEDSSKMGLNIIDFSIIILKKSRYSINRVLKVTNYRTRLYIGRYVNSKLPSKYINDNIYYIQDVLYVSLKNILTKLGLKINKQDYDDKINEGLLFLMESGNNLDINNNRIINDENLEFTKRHRKIFYWKSYYYYLNQFKRNKFLKEVVFIENVLYSNEYVFEEDKDLNDILTI